MATSARIIIKSALISNGFELHLSTQRYCYFFVISIYYTSWIYRNVEVHSGYNDETATHRISSVDGEQR